MMSVENVRVTATRLAPGTGAPPGAGAMRKLRPMVTERLTRRVLLGSTAALAIAAAAACTAPGGSASQAPQLPQPKKKVLSIGATLEPPTMDFTTSDAASIPQVLLYNVYETLVKLDAEGKIRPLLATRWDVSADGLVYTFNLDGGAKFASGTPVNAQAVVASIERMKAASSPTIAKVHAVVDTLQAVDAGTVRVTLSRPSNSWLFQMTSKPGIVVDPALSAIDTKPMGSGPYALGAWAKGSSVTLAKNTAYWGTPGRFDEVVFKYFVEPNAMISAMLSGDLDVISNLQAPSSLAQFQDTARYTVVEGTTTGEVTLGFNHSAPALANLKVRQAICHAIDRRKLVDTVWDGHGMLIGSMVAPTDPYYEDLSGTYPFDPAKAKQLLAEAGVGPISLRFRVPVTKYATDSAQFIAAQLKDVGIATTIEELDFTRWLSEVFQKGDYDMTIVAHVETRDIGQFANPGYYWRYNNTRFQQLIAQADAAPAAEFDALMKQAAKLLADDAAACWLWLMPNLLVARTGISGIPANATSLSFDLATIASKN